MDVIRMSWFLDVQKIKGAWQPLAENCKQIFSVCLSLCVRDNENENRSSDGLCLSFPLRGLVFIAHGAAEHCGPYDEIAQRLKELSLLVFAHDHGEWQTHIPHYWDAHTSHAKWVVPSFAGKIHLLALCLGTLLVNCWAKLIPRQLIWRYIALLFCSSASLCVCVCVEMCRWCAFNVLSRKTLHSLLMKPCRRG